MEEGERADLRRRLFLLIALEAEELGQVAVDGQNAGVGSGRQRELAERARDVAEKLLIVADAVSALV